MVQEIKRPSGWWGGCLGLIGLGVALFFSMGIIGVLADEEFEIGGLIVVLVLVAGGLLLAWYGWRVRKRLKLAGWYVDIIANQNHSSVDNIARLMGRPDVQSAMREIQAVINKGYLPGYTLDPDRRRIYRIDPLAPPSVSPARASGASRRMVFVCDSCGARNEIDTEDGVARCSYCGSPYSGQV